MVSCVMILTHITHANRERADEIQAGFSTSSFGYFVLEVRVFPRYLGNRREEQVCSIGHPATLVSIPTRLMLSKSLPDPSQLIQGWDPLQCLRSCVENAVRLRTVLWKPEFGTRYGKERLLDDIQQDVTHWLRSLKNIMSMTIY